MKPILLATDGSPSAEGATSEAIELAKALDAPLVIVSVAHLTVPPYGGYYGYGEIVADLQAAETERVKKVLAELSERAAGDGVTCETVPLTGPAPAEICRIAGERTARLVVVGAHGWGRIGRVLHGSVSTAVLHEAPCPVLVVQGDEPVHADNRALAEVGAAN